jgi:hypothetical protein
MTEPKPNEIYERTMKMLKPALERVATDSEFRNRLEVNPLAALAEMNVELDADTRRELEGKRFSEFWAQRQQAAEGPVGVRDLPPEDGLLTDKELGAVSGGFVAPTLIRMPLSPTKITPIGSFAPPYVPVGPAGDE